MNDFEGGRWWTEDVERMKMRVWWEQRDYDRVVVVVVDVDETESWANLYG